MWAVHPLEMTGQFASDQAANMYFPQRVMQPNMISYCTIMKERLSRSLEYVKPKGGDNLVKLKVDVHQLATHAIMFLLTGNVVKCRCH